MGGVDPGAEVGGRNHLVTVIGIRNPEAKSLNLSYKLLDVLISMCSGHGPIKAAKTAVSNPKN